MARYIDAYKLEKDLPQSVPKHNVIINGNEYPVFLVDHVLHKIRNYPTADVVEVKHGEWFLLDECANEGVYCSVCHKKIYRTEYANQKIKSNYCPNCGAKMDGERKENE